VQTFLASSQLAETTLERGGKMSARSEENNVELVPVFNITSQTANMMERFAGGNELSRPGICALVQVTMPKVFATVTAFRLGRF
jgi:hypothetical protein